MEREAISTMSTIDPDALTEGGLNGAPIASLDALAQIGPYRIVRTLGRGGMGQVFLGERREPKRLVAIKLMLSDDVDAEALARFRREMEVLARLDHQGIARLYESGAVQIGATLKPWYAMEYVEGLALDEFVRTLKLEPAAIIALAARVARALHHAHQRGVIHRDIKPANIVVNAAGEPKVLDFGIAKLTEGDARRQHTRLGQIVGTLAYMSPEQINASHAVDVRSDVYSLGVVLYQLLSGELPVELKTDSLLDAIKELTEGRRRRLSERAKRFSGDVELIVETATRRELERRYDSAASLADDLEAFLAKRPVKARRPGVLYVGRKFTERNPLIVAALVLAVGSLIGATLWSLWSLKRAQTAEAIAQSARADAEARADEANAVTQFLREALASAAPDRARGREVKLIDVLTDASRQTLKSPNVELKIRQTLLETWLALGLFDEANQELERMRALCGSDAASPTCALMASLAARVLSMRGDHEQALKPAEQGVATIARALGADSEEAIDATLVYADVLNQLGDSGRSIAVLREASAQSAASMMISARLKLKLATYLSDALAEQGDLNEAESVLASALPSASSGLGADHPTVLIARNSLISFKIDRADFAGAVREYETLLADAERVLGPEHRVTMTVLGNLGATQNSAGDLLDAEKSLKRRAEVFVRRYASDWKSILNSAVSLAAVQQKAGRLNEGQQTIERALAQVPSGDAFPAELANAYSWQAFFWWKTGDLARAETGYRALIKRFVEHFGEGDVQLARYRARLGAVQIDRGEFAQGRQLIDQALPKLTESYGEQHPAVSDALKALDAARAEGR
jgi:eukaryotic-like serine/threonine-protein kinase